MDTWKGLFSRRDRAMGTKDLDLASRSRSNIYSTNMLPIYPMMDCDVYNELKATIGARRKRSPGVQSMFEGARRMGLDSSA